VTPSSSRPKPHTLICFVLLALAAFEGRSAELRPFAAAHPLELHSARWTDGFWAERFAACQTQTIPTMWRIMSGTDYSQYLENFRIAAGLKEGRYRGAAFNDGELYKWIEAACLALDGGADASLRAAIDEAVTTIAKAQRSDGYLHTQALVRARRGEPGGEPFQDRNNFELYNLGHLMTAACVHHQLTGDKRLLEVARRAADFLVTTFQGASPEVARSSVCPSHFMGLVDLYRQTGEARYLELAKTMFALRSQISNGGDDNQDRIPFDQQSSAMGHAVRANYLYAGATDLYLESGDDAFRRPLEAIWRNLTARKMYITGGCGALYDGASPFGSRDQRSITRTHQAYGHDYELPNVTAHSETCANIGNVLWNWRMFLATGEARFMDVIELALYNSVLSGVSLEGSHFLYTNPLRVTDPLPVELRWPRTRVPHLSSFCCPPNIARTVARSAEFAYARSPRALWINLYNGSTVTTALDEAGPVSLTQNTRFPWDGRIRITVNEATGAEFALKLRIPEWAGGARISINREAQTADLPPGHYTTLTRRWQKSDVIELELPMEPRLMEAHPLIEETTNQLAVKRGPVVYCLESADLPEGIRVGDICLPSDIRLRAIDDSQLLGGVVTLHGSAEARPHGDWRGRLYREMQTPAAAEVQIRLIPYYAWGNRAAGDMTVWMPRAR
jgi:uncharacterized protein